MRECSRVVGFWTAHANQRESFVGSELYCRHRPDRKMSVIVGNALDDLVGAIVARKSDEGFMSAVDRQFLEMELSMLKGRIDHYKQGEKASDGDKELLKGKLAEELANQKDIFTYLNGELAKKTDEIVELQERLIALQEENDRQIADSEARLMAAKDEADFAAATSHQAISAMQVELDMLNAFKKHKAEIEADLLLKTRQIEDNAVEHATAISDLERKHVMEKDRLKKEMLLKLRETKANLLKMTDSQLDTTTKRTIAENEQMASELAWQSKEAEKLIKKNDKLLADNSTLRRELELSRQTETEMAKKVNVYQKTLDTLISKLSSIEASKEADAKITKMHSDDAERKRTDHVRHTEILMARLADANDSAEAAEANLRRTIATLNDVEARHAAVLALQDDAVRFALQCFDDVRQRRSQTRGCGSPPTGEVTGEGSPSGPAAERTLATVNAEDREEVLGYLLEQLRAYQHQLQELALHSAWEQHVSHQSNAILHTSSIGAHSLPPIAGSTRSRGMSGKQTSPEQAYAQSYAFAGGGGGRTTYGVRGAYR